jgi:hypothetical protein
MSKIVSVVTEKPQTNSLLKSIINEWPWDKKKEEPKKEDEPIADDEGETPDIELKALDTFSGKLIQSAPNTSRYVIKLPASSIRPLYFDKAGPENLVKSLNDAALTKFIANPTKAAGKNGAVLQKMPDNFKFSDQLKGTGGANYAILLDVPDEISKKLEAAKSAGDAGLNEARTVLIEALAHKFYVLVLNISAASKIAEKVDAAGTDLDAVSHALTPNILVAMPKAGEVKVIRDAIMELNDDQPSEKTDDKSDDKAKDTEDKPEAAPEVPKTVQQQFKSLLDKLGETDDATFNHIAQLLADIGQAADKKKKMAEISNLVSDD